MSALHTLRQGGGRRVAGGLRLQMPKDHHGPLRLNAGGTKRGAGQGAEGGAARRGKGIPGMNS